MDLDPLMKGNIEKRIEIQSSYNQPYTQKEFNSAYDYVKVKKPGMYSFLVVVYCLKNMKFLLTEQQLMSKLDKILFQNNWFGFIM